MCLYYSLYQVWQTWDYSLVFVQLACWHIDVFTFFAAPFCIATLTLFNVEWRNWWVAFPASRYGFFHVKTAQFVCLHHSLPTFGPEIVLFARMSAPLFADFPRCAFILTQKVAVPAAILFRSISQWLLSKYPRQVPSPTLPFHLYQSKFWLPSTTTDCHTSTTSALLSACHEVLVKTFPIQADLSWSPPPLVFPWLRAERPANGWRRRAQPQMSAPMALTISRLYFW